MITVASIVKNQACNLMTLQPILFSMIWTLLINSYNNVTWRFNYLNIFINAYIYTEAGQLNMNEIYV